VQVAEWYGESRRTDPFDETALVAKARSGEEGAFEQLVGRYRGELHLHCYRFLGSQSDAEDALQETLTAAWRGLAGYEARASVRTWLYRIATSRCMNILRAASRRPRADPSPLDIDPPEPSRLGEVLWLEPYPDYVLEQVADSSASPEARYEQREAVSLAFVTALQLLPPRQRAALILCDVLGFRAREVAELLDTTDDSVYAAVKRARVTLQRRIPEAGRSPLPNSPEEAQVLGRLVRAWEDCDAMAIVALMTDDVWLRMPPSPFEYQGRERAARFFSAVPFQPGRRFRLLPTRANGQPAFGLYLYSTPGRMARAFGFVVVTLSGGRVSAVTHFRTGVMPRFGLPQSISV
jgi:RNA polymerase sigma-70 factor (ECF subfamily)